MKNRLQYNYYILVFLAGLSLYPLFLFDSDAFGLTIEEERVLGEKFLRQIQSNFEIIDDDFSNQYINELGQYLITPVETKHFPFNFYIIRDSTLNAFAAPGGHIFIYSGLIEGLDRLDELAAVICHEIGHVAARHLSERIEQDKKVSLATMAGILAGVLIGSGEISEAVITGSMAAGVQAQLHYSRDDERQADQLGFKYMTTSGFDPSGLISLLNIINKGQWVDTGNMPTYLRTHPTGPERMSNLDGMLRSYESKDINESTTHFKNLFPFFKIGLMAKTHDPYDSERLLKLGLEKTPTNPFLHFGLGIVFKERSEYDQAIHHFEFALRQMPNTLLILRHLGETYQMRGQDKEAISVFKKALRMDEADNSIRFLLAQSYENLEAYGEAIQIFEKLASFREVKDEVFRHLGVSYGRSNRLDFAHYNFGIYFMKLKQRDKALFHFQKADSFSKNNPVLKKKIQKALQPLQ